MACIDYFDCPKDPIEFTDYSINWEVRLDEGDTIVGSTWIIKPNGLVHESDEHTSTLTTIWLSGGEAGKTYTLTNVIETASGRSRPKSYRLKVENK